jgi:hypothetical protein
MPPVFSGASTPLTLKFSRFFACWIPQLFQAEFPSLTTANDGPVFWQLA